MPGTGGISYLPVDSHALSRAWSQGHHHAGHPASFVNPFVFSNVNKNCFVVTVALNVKTPILKIGSMQTENGPPTGYTLFKLLHLPAARGACSSVFAACSREREWRWRHIDAPGESCAADLITQAPSPYPPCVSYSPATSYSELGLLKWGSSCPNHTAKTEEHKRSLAIFVCKLLRISRFLQSKVMCFFSLELLGNYN